MGCLRASASILTATEMVGDPAIRLRLVQIVGSNFLYERNPIGIRRPKAMPANSAGSLFNLDSSRTDTRGLQTRTSRPAFEPNDKRFSQRTIDRTGCWTRSRCPRGRPLPTLL
jgi:hypothetical protein